MDTRLRFAPLQRLLALLTTATVVVVLGVLLAPAFVGDPGQAAEIPASERRTLSVSGTGTVRLEPDIADLQLGVVIERTRAREAEEAAAGLMDAIVASLLAADIDRTDIATAWLSLEPVYDSTSGTSHLVRYRMTNVVALTVRNLDNVGVIVDGAVDAGATTVSGIAFRVNDRGPVEALARQRAVADARSRADALAQAAVVHIIGVVSITEGTVYGPVTPGEKPGDDSGGTPTPVLRGMVELSVTVSIVYEIG